VKRLLTGLLVVVGTWACTPALNWRDVTVDRMTVLLPCKPDRAQRVVSLGQRDTAIEMAGCEAAGVLYAVSHTEVRDVQTRNTTLQQWQTVALDKLQSVAPRAEPINPPKGADTVLRWAAAGKGVNGEAIEAQLAWFTSGTAIYHLAVYAKKLTSEQLDTLFSDIRIQ
jgi:hypothetical protein